jgi:hypothetical protein
MIFRNESIDGFRPNLPRLGKVGLVANNDDGGGRLSIVLHFLQPFLQVLESVRLAKVEHNDGAHCAAVVGSGDRPKPFLASRVPYLILDDLPVDLDCLGGEFNADGGLGVLLEGIVDVLGEQVGFADSGVSDDDYLEEEVEFGAVGHALLEVCYKN